MKKLLIVLGVSLLVVAAYGVVTMTSLAGGDQVRGDGVENNSGTGIEQTCNTVYEDGTCGYDGTDMGFDK